MDVGGTATFSGALTIASSGAADLFTIKDTNATGNGASPYIRFKDSGDTGLGYFGFGSSSNSDLYVSNSVVNGDITFRGTRSSGAVTALTLDMSDGGAAIFNSDIKTNSLHLANSYIVQSSGDLTLDVAGEINLDADGGKVRFKDGGTDIGFVSFSNTISNKLVDANGSCFIPFDILKGTLSELFLA